MNKKFEISEGLSHKNKNRGEQIPIMLTIISGILQKWEDCIRRCPEPPAPLGRQQVGICFGSEKSGEKKAAWRIGKEDPARAEKTPHPNEYTKAVTFKLLVPKATVKNTLYIMTLYTCICITEQSFIKQYYSPCAMNAHRLFIFCSVLFFLMLVTDHIN